MAFLGWIYWTIIRDDPSFRGKREEKQKAEFRKSQESAHLEYLTVYRNAAENGKFEFLGGCYMTPTEYETVPKKDFDGSSAWNAICPSGRYWYRKYRVEKGINGGFPLRSYELEWKACLEKTDAMAAQGRFEFINGEWTTPEEFERTGVDPWEAPNEIGQLTYRTWYVSRKANPERAV